MTALATLADTIADHEQRRDQARQAGNRQARKFHAKAALHYRRQLATLLRRRGEQPHRPDWTQP